jgi:hypothetical protein
MRLATAFPTTENLAAMRIGVTFSQHEAEYRDLPVQQAFENILEVSPAVVRIAAYWSEIEATRGVYDFSSLDRLLAQASQRQRNHWTIQPEFLAEEVAVVRRLDPHARPVVVNAFVETHPMAQLPAARASLMARAEAALQVADVLGLDVYPSRTQRILGHEFSVRWPAWLWSGALTQLRALAVERGKDAWIVEGQAEPWTIKGKAPPAAWPGAVVEPSSVVTTLNRFQSLGYTTVLLWGAEHWEDARNNSDDAWWDTMSGLFARQEG